MRRFLRNHGRKLWWLHSAYALGLGLCVVTFAQKGFDHARWLSISLGVTWIVVILFFRLYGSGTRQSTPDAGTIKARIRFYAMTYVLKNLYQGMLFFLLPFYWKSTTLDAPNVWFVALLAICAVLSTLDIVFDRVLMRWRTVASVFHGVILFGCLNLVIPALLPDTRTLVSLLSAAGVTVVAFFTLHVPPRELVKKTNLGILAASLLGGVGAAYFGRVAIPPVPMYLSAAAVGPSMLLIKGDQVPQKEDEWTIAMEVKTLHATVIQQLIAVTDVVVPGGKGDRLHHVWRHDGKDVHRTQEEESRVPGPRGSVRLRSSLTTRDLPKQLAGSWSLDVETEDGQLVGRTSFTVID